jgi:hypothetical protein
MSRAEETAETIRGAIGAFLKACRRPALLEPGEELLLITGDNLSLETRGEQLILQAWDRTRNITRRVSGIAASSAGRTELIVERFARKQGRLFLLDLERRSGAGLGSCSSKLVFRERFRRFLRRQFARWTLAELSTDPNLEFSLSPVFPRAFLRHGQCGWAAIACPPDHEAAAVLSFGLIWLDYLRSRERHATLEGLAIYVPAGKERAVALRLLCLDPDAARFELFTYSEEDFIERVDPADYGNLDTCLEPCRSSGDPSGAVWQSILSLPGVEGIRKHDGRLSLRVRGLEFAELHEGVLRFGMQQKRPAAEGDIEKIEELVEELTRIRSPQTVDPRHPLYRQSPEAWLESQVRARIETMDAALLPAPLYGQVPAFAAGERGVLDLLGVDREGRLAVIEIKASADLHLPLQAIDYWIRVKWHLDRGEFAAYGYFPGIELRNQAPRLLLVSPALEFHPTTETVLRFFAPPIEVVRIGVGVEWRKELQVMFRVSGARRPGLETPC